MAPFCFLMIQAKNKMQRSLYNQGPGVSERVTAIRVFETIHGHSNSITAKDNTPVVLLKANFGQLETDAARLEKCPEASIITGDNPGYRQGNIGRHT